MVSTTVQRSRSRPSSGAAEPPAKRARHNDKAPSTLESLVLGKDRKPLKAVTSNGIDVSTGNVINQQKARVGIPDEGGDAVVADVVGSKRSAGKRKETELAEDEESSSGEEEDDEEEDDTSSVDAVDDDDGDKIVFAAQALTNGTARLPNGHAEDSSSDDQAGDADKQLTLTEEKASADDGPSFGELANIRSSDPIDIEIAFAESDPLASTALNVSSGRGASAPSATSLATVLTQALKTNDRALLETCFQTNDLDSIRSTIERLPSQLVAALLQTLAERMHRTPGRASILMVWVQWSLVAHGGYLASNAQVVKSLKSLHRVIKMRAESLPRLLPLKGRLDLVAAQMELRRSMAQRSQGKDNVSDEEGDAVIFIEGAKGAKVQPMLTFDESGAIVKPSKRVDNSDSDADDSDSDMDDPNNQLMNGAESSTLGLNSSDEEESDEDGLGGGRGGLIDDEAESTDDDDLSDADLLLDEADVEEDEEDGDEVEEDDEDDESDSEVEVAPKLRRSNAARLGGFAV